MARKDRNIHFRQTPRSFSAERQVKVFSRLKRNIPYAIYKFSRSLFYERLRKIKQEKFIQNKKIPPQAKSLKD